MRLIDADYAEKMLRSLGNRAFRRENGTIMDAIKMISNPSCTPTVDAIEVVRCKDCKHYKEFRTKRNKQIMRLCCRMGKNDMEYPVKPYDFCSFGERRNEDVAD